MSRAGENKHEYKKLSRMTLWYTIGCAAVIVALFFTLWMEGILISDNGMAPVIQSGDVILFDRLSKYIHTPGRGDIYAFYDTDGSVVTGRILGLPGERIQVDLGNVYVNGIFVGESTYATYADSEIAEVTVPSGCFFLMPDDRTLMVPDAGNMTVPVERLIGRAAARVSPIERVALF